MIQEEWWCFVRHCCWQLIGPFLAVGTECLDPIVADFVDYLHAATGC